MLSSRKSQVKCDVSFDKLTKVTYGEETFWKELTFRCKYALGDVSLSSDIAVSGQDDDFENEGDG